MRDIVLLFSNQLSVKKHWQKSIDKVYYNVIEIKSINGIFEYLQNNDNDKTILMLDETDIKDIQNQLTNLQEYSVKTILLNTIPNINHALTLLKYNIYGYENSYIHKTNLMKMLNGVSKNKKWFFRDLTNFIINNYIQTIEQKEEKEAGFLELLTQQEKEIASLVANGFTNKEIAISKKIALSTVKNHIHHIFEKVGVSDRFSLALKFKQHG